MKVKAALAAVAIAGGAGVAIVGPAGPALGFFSPPLLLQVSVNSPGTLVAGGAGVDVTVQAECAGTDTANVNVSLTERAGSQVASGFAATTAIQCTNAVQTVTVRVVANPGRAFKVGTAIATGEITACTTDFSFCGNQLTQPTISITK